MYGSIVWQYACSSHVYGSLQIAKGKKGAAGRVNCFDHCIVVVLSREDMAATYPKVVGRMVYSRADFRLWIRQNEAVLNGMGMRLNKAVYKEVYGALSERRYRLLCRCRCKNSRYRKWQLTGGTPISTDIGVISAPISASICRYRQISCTKLPTTGDALFFVPISVTEF
jgi:hypothetical protein